MAEPLTNGPRNHLDSVGPRQNRVEHVMGTAFSFDLRDPVPDDALQGCIAWLHWVDATFSTYRDDSDIAFMDECVAKGVIPFAALEAFGKKQAPYLAKNVAWAAQTQVAHWMTVLAEWKTQLGADWDKTYAASNTIYVARQNNVLFSVLAQFFGPDAINNRLLLIETISFTTTPADMLESLTRIIADRSVGALFFGNYHLMDYELMGGDARAAIIAETGKRGMTPFLPPVVPFGSKQWPTLVTPGPGPATIADLK